MKYKHFSGLNDCYTNSLINACEYYYPDHYSLLFYDALYFSRLRNNDDIINNVFFDTISKEKLDNRIEKLFGINSYELEKDFHLKYKKDYFIVFFLDTYYAPWIKRKYMVEHSEHGALAMVNNKKIYLYDTTFLSEALVFDYSIFYSNLFLGAEMVVINQRKICIDVKDYLYKTLNHLKNNDYYIQLAEFIECFTYESYKTNLERGKDCFDNILSSFVYALNGSRCAFKNYIEMQIECTNDELLYLSLNIIKTNLNNELKILEKIKALFLYSYIQTYTISTHKKIVKLLNGVLELELEIKTKFIEMLE